MELQEKLQDYMKPSSARCAIDCALWDIEAKKKIKESGIY